MVNENIKFPRAHMAVKDQYFYYCDERNNTLNVRVSDGSTSFVYPFETSLGSNQVKALEYDGNFFWTLQQGVSINDHVIKKWAIDNYVCKLVTTLNLSQTSEDIFQCPTFALECYSTNLSEPLFEHSVQVTLDSYYSKIEPGTVLTLGPNTDGVYEDVTVTGTINGNNIFGLDFYTFNSFDVGTPVYFSKNIWLVNDYTHTSPGGSLYKISLITNRIETVISDDDFGYVNACCFYNSGSAQYILYVVETTLRFFNIDTETTEISMFMDNRQLDTTVIPIYDIKVVGDTVYRLQNKATYFGTNFSWGTYNYQLSTIRSFIDSITIDVVPKILPSNGINTAEIVISIRDQYNNPAQNKPVLLEDSDTVGFITILEPYTNLLGVATSYYKAGVVPAIVEITATATQYD